MVNPALVWLGLVIIGAVQTTRVIRFTSEMVEMCVGVRASPIDLFHPSKVPRMIVD